MSVSKLAGIMGGIFCVLAILTGSVYAAATISSSNIQVSEASNVATFTFTVSETSPEDTFVNYHTADGSATAPQDYEAVVEGFFIIPANSSSATVDITLHPDNIEEPNEVFSIIIEVPQGFEASDNSWTATIVDDDSSSIVITTSPPRNSTSAPLTALGPALPTNSSAKKANDKKTPNNKPAGKPHIEENQQTHEEQSQRSAFVSALRDPTQLDWSPKALARTLLLAAFLILLIAFPAELFNATLQDNYDEVSGWFKWPWLSKLTEYLHLHTPAAVSILFFTGIGALVSSLLSPDFGMNKATAALLLGMFITILICSLIFDEARRLYMQWRFKINSKLRTHALGLVIAGTLVLVARLFHFLPGYVYGIFTAIVFFGHKPSEEEDGHGLAVFSLVLLALAAIGWFGWIPAKGAAMEAGANFWVLVLDCVLASLWVGALGSIVFGLLPMRFSNGEQVKKWSAKGWLAIYGLGMALFVHTLFSPTQNVYGQSGNISWASVLTLFAGFGSFSVLFWAYFRYRHLWRAKPT